MSTNEKANIIVGAENVCTLCLIIYQMFLLIFNVIFLLIIHVMFHRYSTQCFTSIDHNVSVSSPMGLSVCTSQPVSMMPAPPKLGNSHLIDTNKSCVTSLYDPRPMPIIAHPIMPNTLSSCERELEKKRDKIQKILNS